MHRFEGAWSFWGVEKKMKGVGYSRIKLITTQRYEPVDTRASKFDQRSKKCGTNKHQSDKVIKQKNQNTHKHQ